MDVQDLKFHSAGRTHVGKVRTCNEDAFIDRGSVGLWAVSDGMGGLRSGDVASGMIVSALEKLEPANSGSLSDGRVRETLGRVNEELRKIGAGQEGRGTMGATVTALLVNGNKFNCLWAGDSRAYRLRNGRLEQLTRDHRYVQELLDAGVIGEMAARQHPKRHVITRAIGVEATVKLDSVDGDIRAGDIFMLSTDGVTAVCDDEDLRQMISSSANLDAACDEIVSVCLAGGAPDNLTLVLIAVS
jgi:serine/threonine-protein phosphatase Stp1